MSSATVTTTCAYCGVGCGVKMQPQAEGFAASGDGVHPANLGRLCVKGSALGETLDLDGRLLHPEINRQPVSWSQALDAVAQGLQAIIRDHGP